MRLVGLTLDGDVYCPRCLDDNPNRPAGAVFSTDDIPTYWTCGVCREPIGA